MSGKMRDFVAGLRRNPLMFFSLTRINNKRFAWHNLAAVVTCLEKASGPVDVKAEGLYEMYDHNNENL